MPDTTQLDSLIAAVRNGDLAQVSALLDRDESLATASTMLGSQPIHAAHFSGQQQIKNLLLNRGVRVDFFLAAELGMLDRVKTELDTAPVLATKFSPAGSTALHRACYWGQPAVAQLLLDAGADPNSVTQDSFLQIRPLGCAVASPDVPNPSDDEETVLALVRLLLDRGADVNGRRRDGLTALHAAAYRGHLKVLRELLSHGADAAITGYDGSGPHAGQTAADMAQAQNQAAAADFLRNHSSHQ